MNLHSHLIQLPRNAMIVVGAYLVAGLLSAAQYYFRFTKAGLEPSWWPMIWLNLVAWAPWPVMTPFIVRSWQKFPPTGPRMGFHLCLHAGLAACVAVVFLAFLTLFRLSFHHGGGPDWPLHLAAGVFAGEAAEFFLIAWAMYWGIGAAGFGLLKHGANPSSQPAKQPVVSLGSQLEREPAYAAGKASATASHENTAGLQQQATIVIKSVGKQQWVPIPSIMWVEAKGIYAVLHTQHKDYLHRCTMSQLAGSLTPYGFVRIHRSTIVNRTAIAAISPASHGDARVHLKSGEKLRASRTYAKQLQKKPE